MDEGGYGRWRRALVALRLSNIVGPFQVDRIEYPSTGVNNTIADVLRSRRYCETALLLLCALRRDDFLGEPCGAYIKCRCEICWAQVFHRYRLLPRANNVCYHIIVFRLLRRRLQISPRVQESFVHRNPVWDARLTT